MSDPRTGPASRWRSALLIALTSVAVLLALVVGGWRLAKSRTYQLFGELVTSVPVPDSVVALTFDDGPVPVFTDSVLDLLSREGVRATFFVIGDAVARQPALTARVLREGHELGNHSFSHERMVLTSLGTVRREVETTDSLILHVEIPSRVEGRAALPMIIRGLKQRGYRFVTVSELLALGEP